MYISFFVNCCSINLHHALLLLYVLFINSHAACNNNVICHNNAWTDHNYDDLIHFIVCTYHFRFNPGSIPFITQTKANMITGTMMGHRPLG